MANEGGLSVAGDPNNRERVGVGHRSTLDRPRNTPFGVETADDLDVSLPAEPQISQRPPTRRLSMNLPESLYDDIARLAESQNMSMTQIVRTGLGLAHIAYTQISNGKKLMITNADDQPIREILIPR